LRVKVIGTRPVRLVEIVRNNSFVHTRHPMAREVSFEFIDPEPAAGESYYYIRVTQADDQMAWSSPIWLGAK
jgi:hypothetical protein